MSRLDLRLIPAHPDHTAGLQFVGYSPRAFSLLGMPLGAIVAGTVADRVVHAGASLTAYIHFPVALVVCIVLLFSGPLLVFTGKLFYTKWRGTLEYGALATGVGGQYWRDCLLFYEYFHGYNDAGLGASHQTGWTGVIARLLHVFTALTSEQMLEGGKMGYFETTAQV